MSEHKPLNVALIGAGSHAWSTVLPTLCHLPLHLVAIVDVNEERAAQVAGEYRCRHYSSTNDCYAAEKDLDAVLLVVGPKHHPRLIAEAVQAGLHVWAEKPAAITAADLDEIEDIVEASGKTVMVGYKKAFMPAVDKIREITALEDSGDITHVVAQYPIGRPGAWRANSSHPLACMLACAGPVKRLRCHFDKTGGGTLSLEFKDGANGTLIMANKTRGLSERYQIFCDGTHVELEDGNKLMWHRGGRGGEEEHWIGAGDDHGTISWQVQNCYARINNRLEVTQGFYHEMLAFYNHATADTKPERGSLAFARALTEIDDVVDNLDHDNWVDMTSADWRIAERKAEVISI